MDFLEIAGFFVEIINKTLSLLDQIYLRKQLLFHLMVSDNLLSCLNIQRRKRNLLQYLPIKMNLIAEGKRVMSLFFFEIYVVGILILSLRIEYPKER